jgi:hypothetical protein
VHFAITVSVRIALLAVAVSRASCQRTTPAPPLFELVATQASGVTFVNALPEDTSFNILSYLYYNNAGGVAAGDINNNGLPERRPAPDPPAAPFERLGQFTTVTVPFIPE